MITNFSPGTVQHPAHGARTTLGNPGMEHAAKEFEALVWRQMLKVMMKTIPSGGMTKGPYGNLIEDELSRALAENGGLKIADTIIDSLDKLDPDRSSLILPVTGRITSSFGERIDPFTKLPAFHPGIDIAAPCGTPVSASSSGTVSFAGNGNGYGNLIMITDNQGRHILYGHLEEIDVKAGDKITQGQIIGSVGNTGRSTGPHLHFEVRAKDGPIDPFTAGLRRPSHL
ncbi:MAG: peptidoglycan DD-metalloendopeptidase family protein [Deltaproteobacteria bacterium]|nr:peptidoglycan DD-metalloendopeptidase family protein [Deltaproteobacteria bacterium]